MDEFFTDEHFSLLNKWTGQKRDLSNAEHNEAYVQLKNAYDLTKIWAEKLQKRSFPQGYIKVHRKPTNQANVFADYHWAKIYPTREAPKELAYTVSISSANRFEISIDTVGLDDKEPMRLAYQRMRGADDSMAPFVARLDRNVLLGQSMDELVDWTVNAIKEFRLGYEDVVTELKLNAVMTDEDLLKHFDGKPVFKTFRSNWTPAEKAIFCRLARSVHSAGLDWWHTGSGVHVRFGRKNAGSKRAEGVLGVIRGTLGRTITLTRAIGSVPAMHRAPLTEGLVSGIETALASEREEFNNWFAPEIQRAGLWPDRLSEDNESIETDEDMEDQLIPDEDGVIRPFNRIYYGPPGTGKTYELARILRMGYEQVIASASTDEWRTQVINEQIAGMKWWQAAAAALYDLGGKATVSDLIAHPFIQALVTAMGRTQHVRQTLWQTLNSHAVADSTTVKQKMRTSPSVFDKSLGSVWTLAGDWEEACADLIEIVDSLNAGHTDTKAVQRYSFVTFHQSYGYEDFIEGLRPVLDANAESDTVQYEIRAGVFKELCRKARLAPDQRFAMVIDEINRGNISKISGS
jgi:5-methylcytosine-specific restriction protein B